MCYCLFSVFSVFGCQLGEIKLCVCRPKPDGIYRASIASLGNKNTAGWCVLFAVCGDVKVSPKYRIATIGDNVTVICTSTSDKTVLWYNQSTGEPRAHLMTNSANGEVLQLQTKYHVKNLAERRSNLTILDVQPSDEGLFICKESNEDDNRAAMNLTVTGTLRQITNVH